MHSYFCSSVFIFKSGCRHRPKVPLAVDQMLWQHRIACKLARPLHTRVKSVELVGGNNGLKYLARYTHRVAISNGRLISLENGQVRFRWRDSRHNHRSCTMRLEATEFIRRFMLHVLPAGFVKIRHFGLLANRNRRQALVLCRTHLRSAATDLSTLLNEQQRSALNRSCPQCRCGTLHVIAHSFADHRSATVVPPRSDGVDSS